MFSIRLFKLVVACSAIASNALPQSVPNQASDLDCISNLELPMFVAVPRIPGSLVSIISTIRLSSGGRVESLSSKGGEAAHHREIDRVIARSKFSPHCSGRTLVVHFSFDVAQAPPSDCPITWVSFSGPNRFVVHTYPILPRIEYTRPPTTK